MVKHGIWRSDASFTQKYNLILNLILVVQIISFFFSRGYLGSKFLFIKTKLLIKDNIQDKFQTALVRIWQLNRKVSYNLYIQKQMVTH